MAPIPCVDTMFLQCPSADGAESYSPTCSGRIIRKLVLYLHTYDLDSMALMNGHSQHFLSHVPGTLT